MCPNFQTNICPNEFAMAAQHDLVGDAPKALLPSCDALVSGAPKCLNVLDKRVGIVYSLSNNLESRYFFAPNNVLIEF